MELQWSIRILFFLPGTLSSGLLVEIPSMIWNVVLECPHLLMLGDFTIHTKALGKAAVQDFTATMTTMAPDCEVLLVGLCMPEQGGAFFLSSHAWILSLTAWLGPAK